jgi:hypothetical protein
MDRGKWEMRGEVRKWTDVPLQKHDEIAERMWVQYQAALHGRNI